MKIMHKLCRRFARLPLIVFLLAGSCPVVRAQTTDDNAAKEVSKIENAGLGKDVIIFKNYAQMLNTAPVAAFDVRAELLLQFIDSRLRCGARLEKNDVWQAIVALTPFRMTRQVQDALLEWTTLYAKQIAKIPSPGVPLEEKRSFSDWLHDLLAWCKDVLNGEASTDIRAAAKAYNALEFEKAAKIYRNILKKNPENVDARNNLALVCMHQCNDPAALLQLQIIKEMKKDYVPGLINLTVVCERLGIQGQAAEAAKQALSLQPAVPAVALNAAWFENVAGNNLEARKILAPLAKLDTSNSKLQNLFTLSKKR